MLSKALQAAAGNAGEATYVDDVFSTYLYTGNGSTQSIVNGVDLATEGGMVWTKARNSATESPVVVDTTRGVLNALYTNYAIAQGSLSSSLTAFNSNGYSVGTRDDWNKSGNTYASWTFRKAEKFFDVVTWTGNGVNGRAISHSLGSTPGTIIVKCTSAAEQWFVWHRSLNTQIGVLNLTDAFGTYVQGYQAAEVFGNGSSVVQPTSTNFTVAQYGATNQSGRTYVAYLFAHDAGGFGADGSENVVSCGSFTVSGGNASVTLGYEPQWVLVKNITDAGIWILFDNMRGMPVGGIDPYLAPNNSNAETSSTDFIAPTATGFNITNLGGSQTFIYIAIRRPMKPPTVGTEVFTPTTYTGNGTSQIESAGFPTDMAIITNRGAGGGYERNVGDRLRGGNRTLFTTLTVAESTATNRITAFDNMVGVAVGSDGDVNQSSGSQIAWNFKRAPGFFDVVCYTGTGVDLTVNHNLGVVPEWVIIKNRSTGSTNWSGAYFVNASQYYDVRLNQDIGRSLQTMGPLGPTLISNSATAFGVLGGSTLVNSSGNTYVAYLFASYPGVSKVGSYTGTGTTQQINCGFTSGARFVLIKATSTTGNWIVADSARGINGSTDPALYLNSTAAEVTGFDWIDADSSGFIVNETATIAANTNGVSYIFLAVS